MLKMALKLMPKKAIMSNLKIYERKIKLPFTIYAGFKSVVVLQDTGILLNVGIVTMIILIMMLK